MNIMIIKLLYAKIQVQSRRTSSEEHRLLRKYWITERKDCLVAVCYVHYRK